VSSVRRSASSLGTAQPGIPRQPGQTFVFAPRQTHWRNPHHIFDFVLSWTWVSSR